METRFIIIIIITRIYLFFGVKGPPSKAKRKDNRSVTHIKLNNNTFIGAMAAEEAASSTGFHNSIPMMTLWRSLLLLFFTCPGVGVLCKKALPT
jgi:hypothetical protein